MNYRFKQSNYFSQLFLLIAISTLFVFCTSCGKQTKLKVREVACRNYLKLLYKSLQQYNNDHASFPTKLHVLFDKNYIDNKRFLYCPNSNSSPYVYIPKNCTILKGESPKPILLDKSGYHKNCLNILYNDGTVVDSLKTNPKQKY